MQLLDEVHRLREQLNQSVRNSNALAEQLHSKLEVQGDGSAASLQSLSGSKLHGVKEAVPQRSEVTQTTPTPTQSKSQTTHTWSHHRLGDPPTHSYRATLPRPGLSAMLPPQSEAKIPLGGIGTLTVKADVQMSDGSTSSLPQSTQPLWRGANTSLLFTTPQSHSSPYVRGTGPGTQHSSHAPSLSQRARVSEEAKLFSTRGAGTGVQKSPHISGSERLTEDTGQQTLDDYLTQEGIPKLEPAMSLYSHHSSSSSLPASLSGDGHRNTSTATARAGLRHTTFSTTQTASHVPPSASALPGGTGREYQSLESRLKQALESSTLQVHLIMLIVTHCSTMGSTLGGFDGECYGGEDVYT